MRLNELTTLEVDPNGKVMRLTDPQLFDYPFVFFSNINRMDLSEEEINTLRQYLDKGGFMMADGKAKTQSTSGTIPSGSLIL